METVYENKFVGTRGMMYEYVSKVFCRKVMAFGFIIVTVGLVGLGLSLSRRDETNAIIASICLLTIVCFVAAMPLLITRQIMANERRLHNGKEYETVVRFGENISLAEGTFSMTVEYSQITAFHRLERSWVLTVAKTAGILLSPAGFTIGDAEGFEKFIRIKCPNLK